MTNSREPWWRGTRGEWYVVGQVALIALVFFGPRRWAGWPSWAFPAQTVCVAVGTSLILMGALLLVAGFLRLGSNLTPLPYPKEDATLIQSGPYRFVRHPMYGGGIVLALGWAILVQSWCTLAYAVLLLVFLDIKSRREDCWLTEKFPGYTEYQRRVRKFVPFIY